MISVFNSEPSQSIPITYQTYIVNKKAAFLFDASHPEHLGVSMGFLNSGYPKMVHKMDDLRVPFLMEPPQDDHLELTFW